MKNSQVMTLASSIIFAGGCSMVSGPPEIRDMEEFVGMRAWVFILDHHGAESRGFELDQRSHLRRAVQPVIPSAGAATEEGVGRVEEVCLGSADALSK